MKAMTAVAVLDRAPSDDEAWELAEGMVNKEYPGVDLELSWFLSDELPPREVTGILLHEYDQLEATHRDAGDTGTYLVIMAEPVSH